MSDSDTDRRSGSGLSRLFDGVGKLVDRMPGGTLVTRGARAVENSALGLLRERMDRFDNGSDARPRLLSPAVLARREAASTLQRLLDTALDQDRASALQVLCAQILAQLTPDEARLLSALADGASYPLIHVISTPRVGGGSRRLVENLSNIGKKAGVQLQDRVRYYVSHLRALELAETGPEDESVHAEYQMLETDTTVRQVLEHVEKQGAAMRARVVRRTLRISSFGREFWKACGVSEP